MRLWLLLSAVLATSPVVQQEDEDDGGLAPGEGREVVAMVCTACHTATNIVSSHMSRKTWDTTITWMQDTQGLGPLEPDVRELILDYLETTQGLSDEGFEDAEGPWASPRYRPNPLW